MTLTQTFSARIHLPILAALLGVACGDVADAPSTPDVLQGVTASSISYGLNLCFTDTSGAVKCTYPQNPDPTNPLADMPLLAGTTLLAHDTCGLSADGTLVCAEGVVLKSITAAARWSDLTFYVTTAGTLHVDGRATTVDVPLADRTARQIAAGSDQFCAVLDDATVRCWQYTEEEKDSGSKCVISSTTLIDGLTGVTQLVMFSDVGADPANTTTCALAGGQVQCWGSNGSGQVGNGTSDGTVSAPSTVVDSNGHALNDVASIDLGPAHGCAVTNDHHVACWGNNVAAPNQTSASWVALGPVSQVSLGTWPGQDAALRMDGAIEVWGGTHHVGPDGNFINLPTY